MTLPDPSTEEDIRRALQKARHEANDHNAEFAAGMRLCAYIIEEGLLTNESEQA